MRTDLQIIPQEELSRGERMLKWFEQLFKSSQNPKTPELLVASQIAPKSELGLHQWLQLKRPQTSTVYKYGKDGRYLLDKKGKPIPLSTFVESMYIRFLDDFEYETIGIELSPNKKLYYRHTTSCASTPLGYKPSEVRDQNERRKPGLIETYEVVKNPTLFNRLCCVVDKYHKDRQKEKSKLSNDILKAALSHKCS
jgi:hypothetical protein